MYLAWYTAIGLSTDPLREDNRSRLLRASLLLSGSPPVERLCIVWSPKGEPPNTGCRKQCKASPAPLASAARVLSALINLSKSVGSVDLTHLERAAKHHRLFPNENRY